jgi:deoxyribodipyrimidine photo-lyase
VISNRLPNPERGSEAEWVGDHLSGFFSGPLVGSPRFVGTQAAADAALGSFDVSGYASKRNDVLPKHRRGASGLSPWIRHGLLTLPDVWAAVNGPSRDLSKFHDELLWQEYARHMYARLGASSRDPIRYQPSSAQSHQKFDPWDRTMACMDMVMAELETDGWLVNQTRMWMASQWTVRHGANWREGEDFFFRHLLDGSRAANRLGWQWTIGAGTGKPYGFSRWQVNKRAPGLCNTCTYQSNCPIERWPAEATLEAVEAVEPNSTINRIGRIADIDVEKVRGPKEVDRTRTAEMVWLTAESLGDTDPALAAHPDIPVVFIFDAPLLQKLQLTSKRLIFLVERLSELATERTLTISLGDPRNELHGLRLATTFAPVPGWRLIAEEIRPTTIHPWPWLRGPTSAPMTSFSTWNRTSA